MTKVGIELEALRLVARQSDAPGLIVTYEVAPAPALEGVAEREGLATVVADLEPEADHLGVVEDG
jgi:hypothetical protein